MISPRAGAAELRRCREMLVARAAFERQALGAATQDLQVASDRVARLAIMGTTLIRRYWLPAGLLLAGSLFHRTRPLLRAVRTGLAVWQAVRLLRGPRR